MVQNDPKQHQTSVVTTIVEFSYTPLLLSHTSCPSDLLQLDCINSNRERFITWYWGKLLAAAAILVIGRDHRLIYDPRQSLVPIQLDQLPVFIKGVQALERLPTRILEQNNKIAMRRLVQYRQHIHPLQIISSPSQQHRQYRIGQVLPVGGAAKRLFACRRRVAQTRPGLARHAVVLPAAVRVSG